MKKGSASQRILFCFFLSWLLLLGFGSCIQPERISSRSGGFGTQVPRGIGRQEEPEVFGGAPNTVPTNFEDITEEQEYYIGRSVAANLLTHWRPFSDPEATWYLNVLGKALALASDRPEIFAGYHFLVLDTGEVNSFGAPGGFIFVTKGMISLCKTEDALAAVIAHEIGHVQNRHPLKIPNQGTFAEALKILASEIGKAHGIKLAQLTELFEGRVSKIVRTLTVEGYPRRFEAQADQAAVRILARIGYNPRAIEDVLREMEKRYRTSYSGFFRTHPRPLDRLKSLRGLLSGWPEVEKVPPRQRRFEAFLRRLNDRA